MFLKKIQLLNFRNFQDFQTSFAPLSIFYGPNGIGKSNLLEAISILSFFRSYRCRQQNEVICFDKDFCKVKGEIYKEKKKKYTIEYTQTTDEKKIKINQVSKKITKSIGFFKTVLFSPDSIQIILGPPLLRRRFYNLLLCQEDFSYTASLLEFSKIIMARNKILAQIFQNQAKVDQLAFWDRQLVKLGGEIICKRQKLTGFLNQILPGLYQAISGTGQKLKIAYKISVLPEKYEHVLKENQNREIQYQMTLFGPHRDEFIFKLDSKNLALFGSRGEQRSALLALKLAELKYLKDIPVLLLDDIYSELDNLRKEKITSALLSQQTIITAVEPKNLPASLLARAQTLSLERQR